MCLNKLSQLGHLFQMLFHSIDVKIEEPCLFSCCPQVPSCKQHPAAGVGVETNSSARGPVQLQMSGSSWRGINLGVCYHHLASHKQSAERGLQLRNTFLPLLPRPSIAWSDAAQRVRQQISAARSANGKLFVNCVCTGEGGTPIFNNCDWLTSVKQ